MAHSVGTGKRGSVNLEINIVPFIDVMSCLTAFLLVTAVWVNTANLKNDAQGRGRDAPPGEEPPVLAVLLQHDGIRVQVRPSGEVRRIAAADWAAFDWTQLGRALTELAPAGDSTRVEIAAESTAAEPISYQQLIAAMDTSVRVGFTSVGVVDPRSL